MPTMPTVPLKLSDADAKRLDDLTTAIKELTRVMTLLSLQPITRESCDH